MDQGCQHWWVAAYEAKDHTVHVCDHRPPYNRRVTVLLLSWSRVVWQLIQRCPWLQVEDSSTVQVDPRMQVQILTKCFRQYYERNGMVKLACLIFHEWACSLFPLSMTITIKP